MADNETYNEHKKAYDVEMEVYNEQEELSKEEVNEDELLPKPIKPIKPKQPEKVKKPEPSI